MLASGIIKPSKRRRREMRSAGMLLPDHKTKTPWTDGHIKSIADYAAKTSDVKMLTPAIDVQDVCTSVKMLIKSTEIFERMTDKRLIELFTAIDIDANGNINRTNIENASIDHNLKRFIKSVIMKANCDNDSKISCSVFVSILKSAAKSISLPDRQMLFFLKGKKPYCEDPFINRPLKSKRKAVPVKLMPAKILPIDILQSTIDIHSSMGY
jgi:hypothetical protein